MFRRSCKARIGGPTCTSQSEPTLYLLSIAVYSMFNQCCQNILSETFKFIYLQTLSWTLGPFEIDPRESRRRKLKSCRWMRRPTAGFENTGRRVIYKLFECSSNIPSGVIKPGNLLYRKCRLLLLQNNCKY